MSLRSSVIVVLVGAACGLLGGCGEEVLAGPVATDAGNKAKDSLNSSSSSSGGVDTSSVDGGALDGAGSSGAGSSGGQDDGAGDAVEATATPQKGKATLLVGDKGALHLTLATDALYWTDLDSNSVRKMALTGGVQTLATEDKSLTVWDVTHSASMLFYGARSTDRFYIRKIPRAGGPLGTAATIKPLMQVQMIRNMVHADGSIYFTTGTTPAPSYSGLIRRLNLDESETKDLAGYQKEPTGVAVDDYVYWTTRQGPALWRVDKNADENPKVLVQEATGALDLALDVGFVYWLNEDGLAVNLKGGTVMRAPRTGGVPVVVADEQSGPLAIALQGKFIWWVTRGTAANKFADGGLWRLAKSGGAPDKVASDLPQPWDLAVNDDAVYWVCRGAQAGAPGGIFGLKL